jgi:O-antigen/teichoic acid export membrane protein
MEPLFRAMSKVQDDLDQTKYLYYRSITLLTAYTVPIYVLLWWIAEPFISVVYGPKWVAAGAPMSILAIAGLFLNMVFPTGVLLAARNRLGQEMVAQGVNLAVVTAAALIGLRWGLEGVAWGIVVSQALLAVHLYALVPRVLPSRTGDLMRALGPGLALGALMFTTLALTHVALRHLQIESTVVRLAAMGLAGGLCYAAAFLMLPIPALQAEAARWRGKLSQGLSRLRKRGA